MSIEVLNRNPINVPTIDDWFGISPNYAGMIFEDNRGDIFLVIRNKDGDADLVQVAEDILTQQCVVDFPLVRVPKGTTIRITQD